MKNKITIFNTKKLKEQDNKVKEIRKLAKEINLQPSDLEVWLNYRNEGKK
ncbi:MAG: hypothetical protein LN546_01035 [Rickettsia endosymbiont of Ecitomorpha arachnoides]|nr:hypothetical protein [Rickettsia endosymbiont of Sceptobius lativentris]MCC8461788.1 hypothetical protein [Rickettsia endosymbiont of Ecitomorpha arachnoides]